MKFYRKLAPETPVPIHLPGQAPSAIKFQTFDGVLGWFATDNESIQKAFAAHIENNRCGLTEVPWEHFDSEYVKKKPATPVLSKPWREELSLSKIRRAAGIRPASAASPVAVVTDMSGTRMEEDLPAPAQPTAGVQPAQPEPQTFTPTVGRRGNIA